MEAAQVVELMNQMRNQLHAEFQARLDAPQPRAGGPKPNKPPEYKGDRSSTRDWVFLLDHYFDLYASMGQPFGDDDKIRHAVNLFREEALHWFHGLVQRSPNRTPFNSYAEFQTAFLAHFEPINAQEIARDKLARLQQTETVEKYIDAFLKISARIDDLSEAETLDRFIRGLKRSIQTWIRTRRVTSFKEAVQMAQQVGAYGLSVEPRRTIGDDPMDLDSLETAFHGMSVHRRPKDRRPLNHAGNGPWGGRSPSQERRPHAGPRDFHRPPRQNITPLSPGERERLRAEGACFRCRQPGHMANECPRFPKQVRFKSPEQYRSNQGRY